jgi:AcrR family transcriptional regulator
MPVSKPLERTKSARGRALDDRILSATLEIIRDRGPLGVNIEAVAAAAGTAKTTIYRRYEDREDLLRAAIESATSNVVIPTSLSTYETFRWLLHEARDMADNVVGRGAAASILLGDDPDSHELIREMIKVRASQLSELAQERIDAGDLKPGLDMGLVATILLGAALGQIIRTGDVDDDWADSVLELLWPAFSA